MLYLEYDGLIKRPLLTSVPCAELSVRSARRVKWSNSSREGTEGVSWGRGTRRRSLSISTDHDVALASFIAYHETCSFPQVGVDITVDLDITVPTLQPQEKAARHGLGESLLLSSVDQESW